MKYEWRKSEKSKYLPGREPATIVIPKYNFVTIEGEGDPNGPDFSERVEALYSISYAIRMMPKKGKTPEGYFEYTVYPLEGLWDLSEAGREKDRLDKSELIYKIMIRQPGFVTEEVLNIALEFASKKVSPKLLDGLRMEGIEDGLSVQMMHIGSYDDEKKSFDLMKDYIAYNGLKLKTMVHREIYLSDPRKSEPDKLKTVLRYMVE
jgi:hypothetical protein